MSTFRPSDYRSNTGSINKDAINIDAVLSTAPDMTLFAETVLSEAVLSETQLADKLSDLQIGSEVVRFDLSKIYSSFEDPQVQIDIKEIEQKYIEFDLKYRGKLCTELGNALEAVETLLRLENKVDVYFELAESCDAMNQKLKKVSGKIDEDRARLVAEHYTFFDLEVAAIPEDVYQGLLENDTRVQFYEPTLNYTRENAKYFLSAEVERAITIRDQFGPSILEEVLDEKLTEIRFNLPDVDGKKHLLSLEEIDNILGESRDRNYRAEVLKIINDGLAREITPIAVHTYNAVIGLKKIEDDERGYEHAMAQQNLENGLSDEAVEALHEAVRTKGVELVKRFYRLMADHLGVEKLLWSDRRAPFTTKEVIIPWDEAVKLINQAYESFSPKLAERFMALINNKCIDAANLPNKTPGAFNMSSVFPEPIGPISFVCMTYLGRPSCVTTLAHESGHAVHGDLAGAAQGALMQHAPVAYCETASIFSEMVTFEFLLKKLSSPEEQFSLLMEKLKDFFGSVVRQISFSEFEKRLHAARVDGPLTTEDYVTLWIEVTEQFYGKDGELFQYQDMDHLWSEITHFASPFYVYSYALGELLTQSLYAIKDSLGEGFEPLYLDLLSAGDTKDLESLLQPFGLNPNDPTFWMKGIEAGAEKWLAEAERLHAILKPPPQ